MGHRGMGSYTLVPFQVSICPRPSATTTLRCELLALVMALQVWCHWLEGSCEPVVVWTDH